MQFSSSSSLVIAEQLHLLFDTLDFARDDDDDLSPTAAADDVDNEMRRNKNRQICTNTHTHCKKLCEPNELCNFRDVTASLFLWKNFQLFFAHYQESCVEEEELARSRYGGWAGTRNVYIKIQVQINVRLRVIRDLLIISRRLGREASAELKRLCAAVCVYDVFSHHKIVRTHNWVVALLVQAVKYEIVHNLVFSLRRPPLLLNLTKNDNFLCELLNIVLGKKVAYSFLCNEKTKRISNDENRKKHCRILTSLTLP